MFVVANQPAVWISREGGFPGTGEPEKQCDIIIGALIGRAMHRQDPLLGQEVVQERKDRFFNFSSIGGATDEDELRRKVHNNERFRIGGVNVWHGMEIWRMNNGVIRRVGGTIPLRRDNKHVTGKETMPGVFGNDADAGAIGRVGTGVTILHENVFALVVGKHTVHERGKMLRSKRPVGVFPPHQVFAAGLFDKKFIMRRTAGMFPRVDHCRTVMGNEPFLPPRDGFIQYRWRQIPMGARNIGQTEGLQLFELQPRSITGRHAVVSSDG